MIDCRCTSVCHTISQFGKNNQNYVLPRYEGHKSHVNTYASLKLKTIHKCLLSSPIKGRLNINNAGKTFYRDRCRVVEILYM